MGHLCSVEASGSRLHVWVNVVKRQLVRMHPICQELHTLMDDVVKHGQAKAFQEMQSAFDKWFGSRSSLPIGHHWSQVNVIINQI